MNILYISHCAPDLPDKGEKIRAHHFLKRLAQRHRVHLACLCRNLEETKRTQDMAVGLASVYAQVLKPKPALARAAVRYGLGSSLTVEYFRGAAMKQYLDTAPWRGEIEVTLVYSAAMAGYADPARPMVLDLCDLDSEKWFEYDRLRRIPFAYAIEGRRLRTVEQVACARASSTILMTENEASLVRSAIPEARVEVIANGVDYEYWHPMDSQAAKPSLAFVGQLDYFPNADGVAWFVREIFPYLRTALPGLEFVIAGRNPGPQVTQLQSVEGVSILANPPDVRPVLASATAVAVPLRLARGLQNKVLEALAMGKTVLTTSQVAKTFGGAVPSGVTVCETQDDWLAAFRAASSKPRAEFRDFLRQTYDWDVAANRLSSLLERAKPSPSL